MLKHKACQGKGTGKADTDRYQVFPGQFQRAYIADGGNRDESPRHDGAAAHEDSRNLAQGRHDRNRRAGGGSKGSGQGAGQGKA